MGNAEQKNSASSVYVHPRLGPIKRIEERKDRYSLIYQIVLENKKLYDDWAFELQKISMISDDILFLPTFHQFSQTNFCGTGGLAKLYFEDYLYSLHPEVVNRRQIKRPFNEQELLYLFYSLIKIESILESQGKTIGEIKPQNILVNQDGYVKVISRYSWPDEQNRTVTWQKDHERAFFAPEQIEEKYKRKDLGSFSNSLKNQSEVFSIGLTILEAGTLKDCSELYGFTSEYRLNEMKMKEYLDIFEMRYSKQLSTLLREMLLINPRKRIKAEVVHQILKPYQYNILNLEEIDIKVPAFDSIPKVEREEKISIKKLGESQLSHEHEHMYQQPFGKPIFKQSNASNPMKISLNSTPSTPHNAQAISNQNPFSNSLQSGFHQSVRQSLANTNQQSPINYQLINQNTNFTRPLPPTSISPSYERHILQNSLPINIAQYEQNNNLNRPHYLTLNSMVNEVGRDQHENPFTHY